MRSSIILVLLLAGCPTFDDADRAAIRKVLDEQRDAWNRADLDGFMHGYAQDVVFTSGGDVRRGRGDALARYKQRYPDAAAMGQLTFSDLEITELGADSALVLGRWQLAGTERAATGIFTLIFVEHGQDDPRWRIVHDHTSARSAE